MFLDEDPAVAKGQRHASALCLEEHERPGGFWVWLGCSVVGIQLGSVNKFEELGSDRTV